MFNTSEEKVLKILGRKKMKITEIKDEFYKDQDEPLHPNITVAQIVRTIRKKCNHHNLDWTLQGQGGGRGGRTIWKVKK